MALTIESPSVLRIENVDDISFLKAQLQYVDKKVDFEISKLKRAARWGGDVSERLAALKASRVKSLLFEDENGYWTYSGLSPSLGRNLRQEVLSKVIYPTPQALPWAKKPFSPFPYQDSSIDSLVDAKHGAIEVGTGLGKSLILTYVIKRLGLKTVVMAPSKSIAKQLFAALKSAFGGKYVGFYGDGKKDIKKLITVCIAASLTRVEKNSPEWKFFSQTQVFIADESHLCPATTLAKVCFGLLANAPYRFFLSATQLRNDGLDMLLDSITGPVVYRMSVKDGIDQGYLATLSTTMVKTRSEKPFQSNDVLEMTREHLYYNDAVNRLVGQMVKKFVAQNQQVLVLVEELKQFTALLPFLPAAGVGFAHGGDPQGHLAEAFRKSDPEALVADFNGGRLPVLVGTSCISIGTDIKANSVTIYLRGGKSEIEVMQAAIGRSTRKHAPIGKTSCSIIDFDIANVESLHRHARVRSKIYATVGPVSEWER